MSDDATKFESSALALAGRYGIACELRRHARSGATTEGASDALGLDPRQIIKFLILRRKSGDRTCVGVVIRGDERLDLKKVQALAGINGLSFADPEFVLGLTGFDVGGVPPVALGLCDVKFVSRSLFDVPLVVGGGGHDHCGMALAPAALLNIPGAQVADIGG